ncbi:MAG: dihydroorotate dehydrogenase [Candidatus Cloacimonetes bacterium]|nr:dihydroorotate dehydrogenase [Candidatus Cloacimonadota bacterium]
MKNLLTTKLGKLTLQNPITVASGTFSFEMKNFYDLNQLGAIITKTITPEPKIGNPPPRIYKTKYGMINSIGLQNPGIKHFLEKDIYEYNEFTCPRIISFSSPKISAFELMLEKLETSDLVDGYEVNVSCPNVENEGIAFGCDASVIYNLTSRLSKKTDKELIIKLSPNVTNIAEIAKAAELGGATALSLINTLYGMAIDWKTGKSFIKQGIGGYSGPAIKPIAVALVHKVSKEVKIPIIAVGGITCFEDVLEFIYSGATAVAIGTAQFPNPLLPIQIIKDLNDYCTLNNIRLSEIKGKVKF